MAAATKAKAKKKPVVIATAAHPDDIEFLQSGTLFQLAAAGWEVHYMNMTNGDCGSLTENRAAIGKRRVGEAKAACKLAGFHFHAPISGDLVLRHDVKSVSKVLAVMREINPDIVLTQSPQDYMEDHMNACRVTVTAAFSRSAPNYPSIPKRKYVLGDCVIYHAMPHGLRDGMRKRVRAELFVDVTSVMDKKNAMLACHRSQKEWLDKTQGMDSYLAVMEGMAREMGKFSGKFKFAEGWRRHSNLGFAANVDYDPLSDALGKLARIDKAYQKWLDE